MIKKGAVKGVVKCINQRLIDIIHEIEIEVESGESYLFYGPGHEYSVGDNVEFILSNGGIISSISKRI